MRSTRRTGGRPVAFLAALLLGAAAQVAVAAAFAGTSASAYRGVSGALGILIAVLAGILAGPLAGVLVALVGGVGFVAFVTREHLGGGMAVLVWAIASAVAGAVADRYREAGRDRDRAHASERRARQAAESESARLARLHELTERLATAVTVDEVGEALVDTVIGSLGAAAAGVALLSMDGTELFVVASRGYPDELVERWRRIPVSMPVILGDAISQRSVVTVETAEEALERYPVLSEVGPVYPFGAQAAAPLLAGDVMLGVIGVSFRTSRHFTSEDRSLVLAIGRQCGQAIERARLFEAERHARERATQLRELASALAGAATPAEIAGVAAARVFPMLGGATGALGAIAADGRVIEQVGDVGFTGRASTTPERIAVASSSPVAVAVGEERPVLLGSPEAMHEEAPGLAATWEAGGGRAWACMPLGTSGRIVGVLCVIFPEPRSFDERQRADLRAVADQVALALERSLLQQAREREVRLSARVERVKAVSGAMNPGLGVGEMASAILAEAAEALGAVGGGVCVASQDGEELTFISRVGPRTGLPESAPVDAGAPVTEAYRTGTAITIEGGEDADASTALDPLLGEPARAVLATPIRAAGRRIGAIGLRFDRERSFAGEELRFVQALAEEAGEALERARLFEAEQRALRRAARLQEVTARLARSVTTEDAVRAIIRGATGGAGADAASIALASDDGRTLRVVRGLISRGTLRLQSPIEIATADRAAIAQVYRTGRSIWVDSPERWKERFADGFETFGTLGRCLYAVPIVAKGEAIGAMVVYFEEQRQEPSAEEAELIRSFAHQAGVALERARAYEAEHEAAMTLQRNLMPEGISYGPNVEAVGRSLPSTRGVHVGGDWYDIVDRPDGTVAFAVGDIAGHGLQAAAAMGQVRSAWRALALSVKDPSAILDSLDRFAGGVDGAFFTTILTMLLDPSTNELRYASAGHPPALIIESHGSTRFLEAGRSVPLGLPFDLPRPQALETLPPGAVLVLYTDGLVERRDEVLDIGLARLAAAAAGTAGRPLAELSDALLALVSGDRHDDVALLTIGPRLPADVFRRTFPAEAGELAGMRADLRAWLDRSGLPRETKEDVVLACTEAATNAIEHAYIGRRGEVHVIGESEDGWLQVSVSDEGRWRDPRPDDSRGRGLDLVRALIGEIDLERGERGTTIRMRVGVP